jgi:hypothetical protein
LNRVFGQRYMNGGIRLTQLRPLAGLAAIFWRAAVMGLTFCGAPGRAVENPHGLHLSTFRFSAKARLIVCNKIMGRPQTGQMTSFNLHS